MVKTWVYEQGIELYEAGKVEHEFTTPHGKAHFRVWDGDKDHIPMVQVTDDLESQCDCSFGLSTGVKGKKCPHEIAVDLFIILKGIKGDYCLEFFQADKQARKMQGQERNELTGNEKSVLRDMLSCERCGESSELNLHRINRQGPYILRNIMPLCASCHRKIHGKEKGHINR